MSITTMPQPASPHQSGDNRETRTTMDFLSVAYASQTPGESLRHALPAACVAGTLPRNAGSDLQAQPKRFAPETYLATPSLRKSVSADSLLTQRGTARSGPLPDRIQRDPGDASAHPRDPDSSRQERGNSRGLQSHPSTMSLSGLLRSRVGRRRGLSNANLTDIDTSAQEDSDLDRPSVSGTVRNRVRARLLSLNPSKTTASGSESLDTPRIAARSPLTGLSNAKAENLSCARSFSSSLTSPQGPSPEAEKGTKRSRSHSFGPTSTSAKAKTSKRLSYGNHSSQVRSPLLLHRNSC